VSGEFRSTTRIVKDLDKRKFLELRRRAQLNDVQVMVGLPANKYHKEKDEQTGKFKRVTKAAVKSGKAVLLAVIGFIHEYGAPEKGIPARPWLRPGIRSGKPDYVKLNRRNLIRILQGTMTKEAALRQLGVMAVGKVQQYLRHSENFKPLKAATIRAKGSDKPLIDTGQMMQSVTYELKKGKTK
jgi:hypothetical protein